MKKIFSSSTYFVSSIGMVFFSAVAGAADWTHWRGADANGISAESGWQTKWPAEGPKQLWKASVGTGFSSMTISKGKIYTMGHDGTMTESVYCLDVDSGRVLWKKDYSAVLDPNLYEGGPNATPTVEGGRVYTLGKRGELFCLDAEKGTVIWEKNINKEWSLSSPTWGLSCSPVLEGDLLILNSGAAGIAVKKDTGELVWKSENNKPGYATPLPVEFNGKKSVIVLAAKTLIGLSPADGKMLWEYPWKTSYDINAADPIFSEGKVFVSSGYDHGCAVVDVSGAQPKLVWENKNLKNHFSSSLLWKGYLYGVDDDNNSHQFKCVSWDTGEVKWSEKFGRGSMMMADGKIIALSEHGELYAIDPSPEAFKPISHAQVLGGKCWTTPVLSNGRIYCRNAKGDLVSLDVSAKY